MNSKILVAGGTGHLGGKIIRELLKNGADVGVIVRSTTNNEKTKWLKKLPVRIHKIDSWNVTELANVCNGVSCVVSAIAGLRDVIVDAQKVLLNAAVAAGVPRFIPSDYSLDFTKLREGDNRNFDLRREFHQYLDEAAISPTSIFNGAFTDLITDQMPVIFFKKKIVLYWGDADYKWHFTTMDDTAAYTAKAAMDNTTPRYLRIVGDQISPREIRNAASEISGHKFRSIRAGGRGLLGVIIKIARTMSPSKDNLYPAWQGMQYMNNMIDVRSKNDTLDNDRYAGMNWTSVKEFLMQHQDSATA